METDLNNKLREIQQEIRAAGEDSMKQESAPDNETMEHRMIAALAIVAAELRMIRQEIAPAITDQLRAIRKELENKPT